MVDKIRQSLTERLAQERRGRLAAERLLLAKQRELVSLRQQLAVQGRPPPDAPGQAESMAERRLWDSIQTIQDGFAIFDANLVLRAANAAYLSVFAGHPEVRPGIRYPDILDLCIENGLLDLAGKTPAQWRDDMLTRWAGPVIDPVEVRFARGPWVRLIDRRARDGDMVSLALDITRTIEREAELKEAQARAEAATRAKSSFLANISHEIRTPMNGVVGMADLLCDTGLTDEQRLYAETIKSSGEALLVIINDILDFSRIEAERLTLTVEPFDLERCIHDVAMLLQRAARDRGLDLLIDYDMFLPSRYVGDAGRLRQVLTNLIGNAIKFTPSGHVLIRAVGLEVSDGQQQLHVTVEDTGIGIAAEHQDLIFGQFNQIESDHRRRQEGTGLGLAICQELIRLMGGTIWVDSEPGRGSCFGFRVTLPLAEDEEAVPLPDALALRRVLVVDDLEVNRTILERQLAACGLEVVARGSGGEALDALRRGPDFDLLLTDHEMPGSDGVALAQAAREAGFTLPIVLLSSSPSRIRGTESSRLFQAVLQKPMLRRDLFRQLQGLDRGDVPLRRVRLLVADDNRTNQLIFSRMVRDLAVDLRIAGDGHEAVSMYDSFLPDLVFMDISMPGMDGRAATRAIRQAEAARGLPPATIFALTAHAIAPGDDGLIVAGMNGHLTKPLRKTKLEEEIALRLPAGCLPLRRD